MTSVNSGKRDWRVQGFELGCPRIREARQPNTTKADDAFNSLAVMFGERRRNEQGQTNNGVLVVVREVLDATLELAEASG